MQKRHLLLSLIAFSFPFAFLSAQSSIWEKYSTISSNVKEEHTVFVDNIYVQSYADSIGIWKNIRQGTSLKSLASDETASIAEIRKVNDLKSNIVQVYGRNWIFVPYSQDYLRRLEEAGVIRQSITQPQGNFLWPVQGSRITSRFGRRWGRPHSGVDIAAGVGTIVVAAQDGVVEKAGGNHGGYGILVVLRHDNTYTSMYGHLSAALVKPGDHVRKGQIIALSGNTGRSTGPHLHFEVRSNDIILDPEEFLPGFDESAQASIDFQQELRIIMHERKL